MSKGGRARRVIAVTAITTFSIMFSIALVGPLLSELADKEGIALGVSPNTSIGLIFSLGGFALAASQIPMAILADKYGRKGFIVTGSVAVGVTVVLMGYSGSLSKLLGLHKLHLPIGWDGSTILLALLRVFQGIAAAATWPVLMAVIASIVPEESMGTAMGVFGASFGLGMSLGPVLGPALAAVDIHVPFILAGVLGILAGGMGILIPTSKGSRVRRGRRKIRMSIELIALSMVAFTLLYSMGSLVVIFPRYMTKVLGLGMTNVAIAMAASGLTYTLLQPLTGRLADRLDKKKMIGVGLPLAGLSVLLASLSSRPLAIYLSMLLFGSAGALAFPAASALVGIVAPRGMEGAYMGIYNAMLSFGVTVSPIVVGVLADTIGYKPAFSTPLALSLVTLALLAITLSRRELGVTEYSRTMNS